MPNERGSYARRTEARRKETTRPNAHRQGYQRIDAHEAKAIMELVRGCQRFYAERGMAKAAMNQYKPCPNPINRQHEVHVIFVRKQQEPLPARSLKAAVIREIVMAARRAGLIKDGIGRAFGEDADGGVPDGLQ